MLKKISTSKLTVKLWMCEDFKNNSWKETNNQSNLLQVQLYYIFFTNNGEYSTMFKKKKKTTNIYILFMYVWQTKFCFSS